MFSGALHVQLKHGKSIWSRQMRLPYILEPKKNGSFSFLSCIF